MNSCDSLQCLKYKLPAISAVRDHTLQPGGGGVVTGMWCTHAWPEVFKTYTNRDLPSPGKTPPKREFLAIFVPKHYPLNKVFLGTCLVE